MESGLCDHPAGLSCGERRARLLDCAGPNRSHRCYFPSPAAPQSHVSEQLRRPAEPKIQGTLMCKINIYELIIYRTTHHRHVPTGLQVLDTVSLPADLPGLSTAEWLSQTDRCRVTTIARLLNQLPTDSSAVITSADTLLTELFSHKGKAKELTQCDS